VSVIVCDVDCFKSINDELGHNAGDTVLKEVANRLGSSLGAFEPIYRFGGEEFVIMQAGAEVVRSMETAESLRQAVSATPILGRTVTMSFGVAASAPDQRFDFDEVFTRADGALFAAKQGGRNRVSIGVAEPPRPRLETRAPERRRRLGLRVQTERRGALIQLATEAEDGPQDWRERLAEEQETTGNWLVRDEVEREHMLELNSLLRRNFRRAAAVSFLAIFGSAPWFGWLTLVPPVIAGAVYNLIQMRLDRLERPEFALATAWLVMQFGTAGGFALAHHSPLFALPLFLLMVIGSAAVFPRRAVILGIAVTALLLVGSAYAMGAHQVPSTPAIVIFPLVMLGIIGLTGSAIGRSAIHYRGAAVVDELTGMLNRAALSAKAAELAHQTALTGERVSVILADLDHFKAINDRHGHSRGDAVLQEVAYRIRKHLRAFEAVYRLGGEEFAVLLTSCDSVDATHVAERIWKAVHAEPVDGLEMTMSCGVATTAPGETFDYQSLFARADAALYAAKHSGRDCVRLDAPPVRALAA
jgi:diguanylate cyclase (GGDEF)-like protein